VAVATKRILSVRGTLLAVFSAWSLPVGGHANPQEPLICVRLLNSGPVPGAVLGKAEGVAARILASAGMRVRWDDPHAARAAAETIDIRFLYSITENTARFATSFPFAPDGVRIIVFFNRVEIDGKHDPIFTTRLLGHVLAHEIGHVLMRTDQHAQEGEMKARWNEDDLATMRSSDLKFTPEDVARIRSNLGHSESKVSVGKQ